MKISDKWKDGLHVVGITIVAFLLSRFLIYETMSIGIFAPIEKEMDFQISDIYNAVEENKTLRQISPDVVVVSIDAHDREALLNDIHKIVAAEPAAIGLDVSFPVSQQNDSFLLQTILGTENLVGATKVLMDDNGWSRKPLSFYEEEYDPATGFINLDLDQSKKVVRTFYPFVVTSSGDTVKNIALKLASIVNPVRAGQLLAHASEVETIDYISYEIPIIDADSLDNAYARQRLKDKVVFVGDVRNGNDMWVTPLHGYTPGVLIHAYALQTILRGTYIKTFPVWEHWLIAIVICVIFVTLLLIAKRNMSNMGNLLIRISQFVIIYLLVVWGCSIFSTAHAYMDFTPAILMLGLGALAFDLWFASYGVMKQIVKYLKNK